MHPLTLPLILIGLLIGPGYFAYCEYLSGNEQTRFSLTDRAERWELPGGAILRFRSGLGYKPQEVNLDPAINDYQFLLVFDFAGSDSASTLNHYQFSVLDGEVAVLTRNLSVAPRAATNVRLPPLKVPYPGRYTMLLEEVGKSGTPASRLTLVLQSNIEKPRMWLVWSGVILLLAGIGLLVHTVLKVSR
ncbi:MAG: hypothetical protein ACKVP2_11545 [Burkholderiales bacterium]